MAGLLRRQVAARTVTGRVLCSVALAFTIVTAGCADTPPVEEFADPPIGDVTVSSVTFPHPVRRVAALPEGSFLAADTTRVSQYTSSGAISQWWSPADDPATTGMLVWDVAASANGTVAVALSPETDDASSLVRVSNPDGSVALRPVRVPAGPFEVAVGDDGTLIVAVNRIVGVVEDTGAVAPLVTFPDGWSVGVLASSSDPFLVTVRDNDDDDDGWHSPWAIVDRTNPTVVTRTDGIAATAYDADIEPNEDHPRFNPLPIYVSNWIRDPGWLTATTVDAVAVRSDGVIEVRQFNGDGAGTFDLVAGSVGHADLSFPDTGNVNVSDVTTTTSTVLVATGSQVLFVSGIVDRAAHRKPHPPTTPSTVPAPSPTPTR